MARSKERSILAAVDGENRQWFGFLAGEISGDHKTRQSRRRFHIVRVEAGVELSR